MTQTASSGKVLQFHNRALTNWLFHQVAFEGWSCPNFRVWMPESGEGGDLHRTLGWIFYVTHLLPPPNIVTERERVLQKYLWLTNDCQSTHIWLWKPQRGRRGLNRLQGEAEGFCSRTLGICGWVDYFLVSKTEISENAQRCRDELLICCLTSKPSKKRLNKSGAQRNKSTLIGPAECLHPTASELNSNCFCSQTLQGSGPRSI